jgi:hypothetical protein
VERHQLSREGSESLLADHRRQLPLRRLVELVQQTGLELLGLDDLVDAVHPAPRTPDPRVVRHENQAAEPRLHRHQPKPLRRAHQTVVEHALEEVDMAMVLLDGGGDARLAAVPPTRPLAVLVDGDPLRERLALADPDLGEAIDDQVINLCRQAIDLDPQVVDRRPVVGPTEVQLDVVRRGALSLLAGSDLGNLDLDSLPRRRRHMGAIEKPLKCYYVGVPPLGGLELHEPPRIARGPISDTAQRTLAIVNNESTSQVEELVSLPDYQSVMLPLLKLAAAHPVLVLRDALPIMSTEFQLTDEDRAAVTSSGRLKMWSRVAWAATYLAQARAVSRPKPGAIAITDRGMKLLETQPKRIDYAMLRQFEEFRQFMDGSKSKRGHADERTLYAGRHSSIILGPVA